MNYHHCSKTDMFTQPFLPQFFSFEII